MEKYPSIHVHDVYTTGDLAALFERSNQTIRRWIKDDRLPASKDDSGRFVVLGQDLLRELENRPGLRSKYSRKTNGSSPPEPTGASPANSSPGKDSNADRKASQNQVRQLREELNGLQNRVDELAETLRELDSSQQNDSLESRVANLEAVLDEMQTLKQFKKITP